jgi:acyl-CoA synthetase (AMP-forming)/AMP-acid ligase II
MIGGPAPAVKFATLPEALAAAAGSDHALTFLDAAERERALPFRQLWAAAQVFAGRLAARGVEPGDRVAIALPTSPAFMDAFFGAVLAGALPVPLYPPLRLGRLDEYHRRTARMLSCVGARVLVTDARIRRLMGASVAAGAPALGCWTVESMAGAPAAPLARTARPEEAALIQFSSGTTVDPKPVVLTHANLLANVAAIDSFIPDDGSYQAGVSWLPLYHDMGLIGCLLEAIYRPGPLCLLGPELFLGRPALWLRAISRHRATVSVAPNFAFGLCTRRVRDEELEGVDLSSWRLAVNGAEPVSAATLRAFAERFAPFGFRAQALTPVYGLSEAALAVTFSQPQARLTTLKVDAAQLAQQGTVRAGEREVVSVGAPIPGTEVEVRDPGGRPLEDDRVGCVFVKGPGVMKGYYGAPEATLQVLAGGWLDTGDLGFVHSGELYLCGRAKEVVILRGANHAPQEFEECLDGLAGVRAGCCVAFGFVPKEVGSEELALLVERDPEAPQDKELPAKIRGRVAERTGIRPYRVELLAPGTLPRTSSGKLKRGDAARQFSEGTLEPPRPVNSLSLARAMVASEVAFLRAKRRGE